MPATDAWKRKREKVLAALFALVAGYTDTITVMRWGCFATMMTGNVLYLGRSVAGKDVHVFMDFDRIFYFILIVTYGLGVVAYKRAELRWPHRGASYVGFGLGAVMFSAELGYMQLSPDYIKKRFHRWVAVGLTPMFGMLMCACTSGKLHAPTTMITGHIVALASAASDRCCVKEKEPLSKVARHKIHLSALVICCTFLGAGLGALACWTMRTESAEGLLLPVPPILAVLLFCYDHHAKKSSLVKSVQQQIRKRKARKRQNSKNSDNEDSESEVDSSDEGDSVCDMNDVAGSSPQDARDHEDASRDLERGTAGGAGAGGGGGKGEDCGAVAGVRGGGAAGGGGSCGGAGVGQRLDGGLTSEAVRQLDERSDDPRVSEAPQRGLLPAERRGDVMAV